MARSPYHGTFKDGNGKVVGGGTISVFLTGTQTAAKIYTANAGGISVSSVKSDPSTGQFTFYVDTADYASTQRFDLVLSGNQLVTTTYSDVAIFTGGNAKGVTIDTATLTGTTTVSGTANISGPVGIGAGAPTTNASCEILLNGKQLRLSNQVNKYADFVVNTSGDITITAVRNFATNTTATSSLQASQQAYLQAGAAVAVVNAFNPGGVVITATDATYGVCQTALPSAPTDGNIANSNIVFYLDEVGNNLKVRVCYSNGTFKTATIALT